MISRSRGQFPGALPDKQSNAQPDWHALEADAEAFVFQRLNVSGMDDPSITTIVSRLPELMTQAAKATRRQQLDAIALAYATHIMMQRDDEYRDEWRPIAKKLGIRVREDTNPLRVLLQATIRYGEDKPSSARRLYSRDVAALEYLASKGVSPQGIAALAEVKGEGLDQWARRWGKEKKALKQAAEAGVAPAAKAASAPTVVITIESTDVDGALASHRRVKIEAPEFAKKLAALLAKYTNNTDVLEPQLEPLETTLKLPRPDDQQSRIVKASSGSKQSGPIRISFSGGSGRSKTIRILSQKNR